MRKALDRIAKIILPALISSLTSNLEKMPKSTTSCSDRPVLPAKTRLWRHVAGACEARLQGLPQQEPRHAHVVLRDSTIIPAGAGCRSQCLYQNFASTSNAPVPQRVR